MKKAIKYSIIVSTFEILVFSLVTLVQSIIVDGRFSKFILLSFLVIFVDGIMNLIMIIVTTCYVIFTYYLLRTTNDLNMQMMTPYLQVMWRIEPIKPQYMALVDNEGYNKETMQPKWLILVIENTRRKQIGKLAFTIEIEGKSSMVTLNKGKASFEINDLKVGESERMQIGILDLSNFQSDVNVKCALKHIEYKASDSDIIVFECAGKKQIETSGQGVLMPGGIQVGGNK